jgi:hypothetical protein
MSQTNKVLLSRNDLTVATKRKSVAALPGGTTTGTLGVVESVSLLVTARLLTDSSQATGFTTLVDGVDDPADTRIVTDSLVRGVNEDDFVVLVGGILVDPVRVEHTEVAALATNTFLGGGTEGTLILQLVNTFVDRLTVSGTLGDRSLTTTTTDTDTVDNVTLLGLVAQTTSLVRARRTRSTVDDVQLSNGSLVLNLLPICVISYLYSQQRTRSKKRETSDCFFLASSSKYL